jgi:hypothetical protein
MGVPLSKRPYPDFGLGRLRMPMASRIKMDVSAVAHALIYFC